MQALGSGRGSYRIITKDQEAGIVSRRSDINNFGGPPEPATNPPKSFPVAKPGQEGHQPAPLKILHPPAYFLQPQKGDLHQSNAATNYVADAHANMSCQGHKIGMLSPNWQIGRDTKLAR
eukprot:scaffold203234_cov11-Tisochrysis_lutea.AAC.1